VPGKRLWGIGAGRAGGSGRRISRPFQWGPRTPSGILLNSDRTSSHSFLPAHRRPFSFFAPFPCSSAHGRGWEEFRLGPGGSGLATVTFARRRSNRVTNSHPSVRARGKPSDTLDFTVSVLSWFQFCHGLRLVQVLSFTVSCLDGSGSHCRVSNTSPLSSSHPPEESTRWPV
jgi:hypothetical protein